MNKKILIAEDDKFLANAYRVKLTKAGFDVKIVGNGEEALQTIKTFQPNLILLDLVMPKKDGFAVLKTLQEQKNTIPVIVASNLGQQEDIKKTKDLHAVDYIVKSNLSLDDIIKKINKHLS